ncbi:MAG: hypothetical protein PVSMB1_09810 [Gemmatimonadaceae bacterium]
MVHLTAQLEAAFTAFATPNILHFDAVLLIACIVTTPRHSITSLRACFLARSIWPGGT